MKFPAPSLLVSRNRFVPILFTNELTVLSQFAPKLVMEVGPVTRKLECARPEACPVWEIQLCFPFLVKRSSLGVPIQNPESRSVLVAGTPAGELAGFWAAVPFPFSYLVEFIA